jgi:hypothetical protein
VGPEVVRGGLHPQHGLLCVGRGEHAKCMPRVDLSVGVEDASCLKLVTSVHGVSVLDLSVHHGGVDIESSLTDIVVRIQVVQALPSAIKIQSSLDYKQSWLLELFSVVLVVLLTWV